MPHLDMVVAMRLHLLIFAAMAGTPSLALAYAPKVGDFADWIGLPATTALSEDRSDELVAAVDAVWQHREAHAVRLQRAVDRLRAGSERTVDIALGCLEPALPLAA
jgi:polysaccharide pyruvyl transferase WcaK-like protein